MMGWIFALPVVALGAFTIFRLVRSWRAARGTMNPSDSGRPGS